MKMKLKSKSGFTLIELLVVVAIIGLLSSVVLASLSTARMKARDTRRMQDLKQIQTALELYRNENGKYPNLNVGGSSFSANSADTTWSRLEAALSKQISTLPKDPLNTRALNTIAPYMNANNYIYYYYTGGTNNDDNKCANNECYSLLARFEDPNNPYRCGLKKYIKPSSTVGKSWCPTPGAHQDMLYSPTF